MRFISPYSRYSIQLVEEDVVLVPDRSGVAREITKEKQVVADFQQGGLTEWEIEAAFEAFSFHGLAEGVNPVTTLAVYDTEGAALSNRWTDDFKEKVEQFLIDHQGADFIYVPKPAAAKPWGNYDEMGAEEIIEMQKALDFNPTAIRLYEHENKGRKTVIEAMFDAEGVKAAAEAPEEVTA